jgi:hypothetical protein
MSKAKRKKQKDSARPVRRDPQGRAHLVIQRDEQGTSLGGGARRAVVLGQTNRALFFLSACGLVWSSGILSCRWPTIASESLCS